MLRHYIKVALRLIRRSLLFSSINLMGFVLGLTAAFLIYLWVVDRRQPYFSCDGASPRSGWGD